MSDNRKKTILIVDDEIEVIVLATQALKREGYNVITAKTVQEAIKLTTTHKPDLILLDIVLPDGSGGDVAAAISHDPQLKNTPIVYITGIVSESEEEKLGHRIGKYPAIAKPLSPSKLIQVIKTVLG